MIEKRKTIDYGYSIFRFAPNRVTDEGLNFAILAVEEQSKRSIFVSGEFTRLSQAFGQNLISGLRSWCADVRDAIAHQNVRQESQLEHVGEWYSIEEWISRLVPDRGLSIVPGEVRWTTAAEFEDDVRDLFEELIGSSDKDERRRDDDQVLAALYRQLRVKHPAVEFVAHDFQVAGLTVPARYTYKNDRYNVVDPASLDYARKESMTERATRICGKVSMLAKNPEFGSYTVVLGMPTDDALREDALAVKRLLETTIDYEEFAVVDEANADRVAELAHIA